MPWSPRASPNFRLGVVLATFIIPIAFGSARAAAETTRSASKRTHVVGSGETLSTIAQRFGVTVDDLAAANGLNPERPLSVGATLTLPRPGSGRFHVVRSGETAAQIARSAGCSVDELARINKLGPSARLSVGQVLKLPTAGRGDDKISAETASRGRRHVVKNGESLNEIAHAYGVGTKILMRANKIHNPKTLRPGTTLVIPDHKTVSRMRGGKRVAPIRKSRRISGERQGGVVVHYVMDGQSWKVIANAYRLSIAKLRKANRRLGQRLRVGDIVRVPGQRSPVAVRVANCGYPGVRFVRRDSAKTIRLMTCKGGVSGQGRRQLSALAANPGEKVSKLLHPQLLRRLQRVADEFPGRAFRVVSGYRAPRGERAGSRHNVGRALDFSVTGIPNKRLYDFCKQLPSTGCGFYPNSTFVHLDYRGESAHWTDFSGPGEAPDYAPRPDVEDTQSTSDPPTSDTTGGNGS